MIEFDVDMGYLEETGELDCVILHDENGEMGDMTFIPEPEDYLKEIYNWAFSGMEGCDEPEWSLFAGITGVIAKYWRETSMPSHTPNDYDDIEF